LNKSLSSIILRTSLIWAPMALSAQLGLADHEEGVASYLRGVSPLKVTIMQRPTENPDSVIINLATRMPLNRLVFVRDDRAFKAVYELSLHVIGEEDKVKITKIWLEEVSRPTFKETKAEDQYHQAHTELTLAPGEYEFIIHLVDQDNSRRFTVKKDVEVVSYPEDEVVVSDLLFLDAVPEGDDFVKDVMPHLLSEIGENVDTIFIRIAVRNPFHSATVQVQYSLRDENEYMVVTYYDTLEIPSSLSYHILPLPVRELKPKRYDFVIYLQGGDIEAEKEAPVDVGWTGVSALVGDLDEAIEQLRYITSRRQIKNIKNNPEEVKRQLFMEFWKELDPSPNTPRNELMDEYYRRVAYADIHFSSFQKGWESDLGMVYIIYGPPDEIERHPFEMGQKPYQIWVYYENNMQFVFMDMNMFGDYRLISPLYPHRSR